jgi:hypothetical protein
VRSGATRAQRDIVCSRRLFNRGGRPLSFTVRFRMRNPLVFLVAVLFVCVANAAPAQTQQDCLITINSDGTCDAAGLHVPCSEIGPKLREAGISPDTHIRLSPVRTAPYAAVSATLQSVSRAGLNLKLGSVNVKPDF